MAKDRDVPKTIVLALAGGLTLSGSALALEEIASEKTVAVVALRKAVLDGQTQLLELDSSAVVRLAQFNDADWKKTFNKDPPA